MKQKNPVFILSFTLLTAMIVEYILAIKILSTLKNTEQYILLSVMGIQTAVFLFHPALSSILSPFLTVLSKIFLPFQYLFLSIIYFIALSPWCLLAKIFHKSPFGISEKGYWKPAARAKKSTATAPVKELLVILIQEKKYWLLPIFIITGILAILLLAGSANPAAAPLIYTLF
jgi:hypothetical protein